MVSEQTFRRHKNDEGSKIKPEFFDRSKKIARVNGKMISDIEALAGEVSSLKRLDQMIQDLQEQMATLEENQRDKTPLH